MQIRIKHKLSEKQLVVGIITYSPTPEVVATIAAEGFDFIHLDHMFGTASWEQSANFARAAKLGGITPVIRLQAEPFVANGNIQVAADAARALAVGFEGLTWSISSLSEAEQISEVAAGWHRDLSAVSWDSETFSDYQAQASGHTFVAPVIETLKALDMVPQLVEMPAIDALFLGLTDLTVQLGHGMNANHADVWEVVDRVKEVCEANGKALWVNPGMGSTTFDAMSRRSHELVAHGADMLLLQSVELLVRMGARVLLEGVPGRLSAE